MLEDYVEVSERIRQFYGKYPNGSLRAHWEIKRVDEQTFIVCTATSYREPGDERPGIGHAWEPFPGKTPFTKDSELMNAETSAWGRALAALGFVSKKIASREEVQARQEDATETELTRAAQYVNALPEDQRKLALKAVGVSEVSELKSNQVAALRRVVTGLKDAA